jgi:hypothetical protein
MCQNIRENILSTLNRVKFCPFFKFFLVRHKLPFFWPKLLPALFLKKPWYPCPFEIPEETLGSYTRFFLILQKALFGSTQHLVAPYIQSNVLAPQNILSEDKFCAGTIILPIRFLFTLKFFIGLIQGCEQVQSKMLKSLQKLKLMLYDFYCQWQ